MARLTTVSLTVGSLAAGAVLATGVTGLALADGAASGTSSSTAATAPSSPSGDARARLNQPGEPMRHRPGPGGAMSHRAPGSEPLHGEVVVQADDGTITTERMIRGSVTAVSASSITVKADDGYTTTFAITEATKVHTGLPQRGQALDDKGTIADVSAGDFARVHGTVVGDTATATDLHAMTMEEAAQLDELRAQHEQLPRPHSPAPDTRNG